MLIDFVRFIESPIDIILLECYWLKSDSNWEIPPPKRGESRVLLRRPLKCPLSSVVLCGF